MNKINEIKLAFVLLFGIVLLSSFASSTAVTYPCAKELPCTMAKGEERVFDLLMQSSPGDAGVVKLKFEILSDKGVAEITGESEFDVGAGEQKIAKLRVKIPEGASEEKIDIVVKVTQSSEAMAEGQVSFSPSFTMTLPVVITDILPVLDEPSQDEDGTMFMIFAAILVLAVLIAIGITLIRERN